MCIYLSNASYFQVWRLYTWPRRIRRYWSLLPCLPFHIHHHPLDVYQGEENNNNITFLPFYSFFCALLLDHRDHHNTIYVILDVTIFAILNIVIFGILTVIIFLRALLQTKKTVAASDAPSRFSQLSDLFVMLSRSSSSSSLAS